MSRMLLSSTRSRLAASAAVFAFVAAGAIGEMTISSTGPARAAPVVTSDLPGASAPSFANLIDRVKPAVVSIKVVIESAGDTAAASGGSMDNAPPEIQKFLKRFGGPGQSFSNMPRQQMIGQGSGFFVSTDGYIVTNNHVVHDAKSVEVTTDAGKTLKAHVVGVDPKTDLAVVKVDQAGDYPFVSFAKDAPRIGDWVVAIGNPFGLGGTVTAGIVSAEGRDIGEGPYDRFLQIDAPINKGNSGGPTFNVKGEVVGVNTAIYSPSGGSIGLGFAIPASTVTVVVDSLEHGGVVKRGYLGVAIQPVSQDIADSMGMKSAQGAIIDKVTPGTPAAAAGLKAGDIVTKLNGDAVKDASDLTRRIGAMKPGDKIQLSYLRNGAEATVDVALAMQSPEQVAAAEAAGQPGAPTLGVELAPANDVAGAGDKGVVIVGLDPNGAAAAHGLSEGNVILEVSGKSVSSPADVKADLAAARRDGKKAVLLRVQMSQGDRFVAIPLPKA